MDSRMSPADLYRRGLALKKSRMFDLAVEDFREAADDPRYAPQAYLQMALCFKAIDRYDDAVQALRQAVASPGLSSDERIQIFYHLGRTLESAGRYAESIEVYGLIRKERPEFGDVACRINDLCSRGQRVVSLPEGLWGGWMETVFAGGQLLKPRVVKLFERTGQWWRRQSVASRDNTERSNDPAYGRRAIPSGARSAGTSRSRVQPMLEKKMVEHRRCSRVPVRLQGYFAAKGRMVAGKGELRDLSPGGCRVMSAVEVPIGTDLECCIFPHNSSDAFVIEGATVRWINSREFGLAFTEVSPDAQQRLIELCMAQA